MLKALNVESEKNEIRREIRAINRLRKRLFGDLESKEDAYMPTCVPQNAQALAIGSNWLTLNEQLKIPRASAIRYAENSQRPDRSPGGLPLSTGILKHPTLWLS